MAKVYIIGDDGHSKEMVPVRVQSEELELQRILDKNYDLLLGDQMNFEQPRRWLLIKREMPVFEPGASQSAGSFDFLFVDQDAIPTIVECKRLSDAPSRREMIGQTIEFSASGHQNWTTAELSGYAAESARSKGGTLEGALVVLQGQDTELTDGFFDSVQTNLREGRMRWVFFLEDTPVGLRSAVDFLNKQMDKVEVFIVEARQFQSDGRRIIVPTLYASADKMPLSKSDGFDAQAFALPAVPVRAKAPDAAPVQAKAAISVSVSAPLPAPVSAPVPAKPAAPASINWDEASYFIDAHARLSGQTGPLWSLYEQLRRSSDFEVAWGTGQVGSFHARVPAIGLSDMVSIFSSGALCLHFGDLPEGCAEKLRLLAANEVGLRIPADQKAPVFPIAEWGYRADVLAQGLKRIAAESPVAESGFNTLESQQAQFVGDGSKAREVVLEVGGEGATIKLVRDGDDNSGWRFRLERDESGLAGMLSEEDRMAVGSFSSESPFVPTFQDAMTQLDDYPWFELHPIYVKPEYRDQILHAVRSRGGETARKLWRTELARQ